MKKNSFFDQYLALDDWWSVDCFQQISTVKYVDDTERRSLLIAADGHVGTQRMSRVVLSTNWCDRRNM